MTTKKWVQCTEELAMNPHKVKAWRNKDKKRLRFIAYDNQDIRPVITRDGFTLVEDYVFSELECLIEVPIQERFLTFYEGSMWAGNMYTSESEAKGCKAIECTHIVKLTFDGKDFKAECVWTKEST